MNAQIHERFQMFLLFSEQFYAFSLISMQIRCYNEMSLMSKVCKHIEEIICYKYVYFGTILCKNGYTKSLKISNVYAVFRAVLCIFVNFFANTMSKRYNFDVESL